jgi:hypothetical protein
VLDIDKILLEEAAACRSEAGIIIKQNIEEVYANLVELGSQSVLDDYNENEFGPELDFYHIFDDLTYKLNTLYHLR